MLFRSVEEDKKSVEKKPKKWKKGPEIDDIEGDDDQMTHQTELDQDAAIDPAPFRFKPYELAHMLDPKSIETLEAFGGIDGLRGLGTNPDNGLVTNTQHIHLLESSHKPNLGTGESVFQRHDLPNTGAGENSDDGEQAEVRVGPMTTDCNLDSSVGEPCEPTLFVSHYPSYLSVWEETMIRRQKSKSMIQGEEITISGGKFTNVGRDYHDHNTTIINASADLDILEGSFNSQYYFINFIYS